MKETCRIVLTTGSILKFRLIAFIGKISYGIYIYQLFTPEVQRAVSHGMGLPLLQGG